MLTSSVEARVLSPVNSGPGDVLQKDRSYFEHLDDASV